MRTKQELVTSSDCNGWQLEQIISKTFLAHSWKAAQARCQNGMEKRSCKHQDKCWIKPRAEVFPNHADYVGHGICVMGLQIFLSSSKQQVTLFFQLSLCLASKMYLIEIQIRGANKDRQAELRKTIYAKQLVCYAIPQSKDVKLFLSLQLKAYQTDVERRLELSKGCFGKQG